MVNYALEAEFAKQFTGPQVAPLNQGRFWREAIEEGGISKTKSSFATEEMRSPGGAVFWVQPGEKGNMMAQGWSQLSSSAIPKGPSAEEKKAARELANQKLRDAARLAESKVTGAGRVAAAYAKTGPEKKSAYTLRREEEARQARISNEAANKAYAATEAKAEKVANLKAFANMGGTRGVYAKYLSGDIDQNSLMRAMSQEIGSIRAGAGLGDDPEDTYRMVSEEIQKLNKTFGNMTGLWENQPGLIQTAQSGPGGTGAYIPSYRPPTDYGGYSTEGIHTPEEVRKYYPDFKTGMPMPDMSQKARNQITADRQQQTQPRSSAVVQPATGKETTFPVRQKGENIQSLSARINLFQQDGDWRYKGGPETLSQPVPGSVVDYGGGDEDWFGAETEGFVDTGKKSPGALALEREAALRAQYDPGLYDFEDEGVGGFGTSYSQEKGKTGAIDKSVAAWSRPPNRADFDETPDYNAAVNAYQRRLQGGTTSADQTYGQYMDQRRQGLEAGQEDRYNPVGGGYTGATDLGDTSDPNQYIPQPFDQSQESQAFPQDTPKAAYLEGGFITDEYGNRRQGYDTGVPSTQRGRVGQIWDSVHGMFVPSTAYADSPGDGGQQYSGGLQPVAGDPNTMFNPTNGARYKLYNGAWTAEEDIPGLQGQPPQGVQYGPQQAPPVQGQPNQTSGYYHPTTGAWVPAGGQSGLGVPYDSKTDLSRVWDDFFRYTQRGGMQQPSDFEKYGFPTQGPGFNILDPSDPMYGVIPGTEGDAPGIGAIKPGEEGPLSTRGMLSASGEMGVETEGLGWNADSIRANINNLPPGDFRMDKLADLLQMYEKFEKGVATASSAADAKLALETMKQEYETQETIAANTLLATQRDEDREWQQELHRQKAFIDSQEAAFNEASRKAEITGIWDGTQTLSAMNLEAQNAAARTAATRATEREEWQRTQAGAELAFRGERETASEALAKQAGERQGVLDKAALVRVESEKIRTQKSKDEFAMTTKMMMAEATGILDGNPTMAGETFAMTRAMQEAEITGKFRPYEMTADGPAAMEPWGTGQTTMAAKSLAFQQDLQIYKEDTTRQLSENTLKIAENANQTNILIESKKRAIEQGKLAEAIDARRGQQKIEQDKLGLETNRLKLETVMSMANPVTLMIFQRSGLMPVLERLLGVELGFPDFPQMLPEGETIPTQQYLTYGSPMDRRLMMTEASLRSGMSDADVQSVIHRQMPGGMGVSIGYRGEGR